MSTPIINVSVTGNDIPSQQYKTVILKPNLVDDVNTLTQAMLNIHGANTKFVIKYDFTLGENITIPENCILEFEGGSISGLYTINGNYTLITGIKTTKNDVTFAGTFVAENNEYYAPIFGILTSSDAIADRLASLTRSVSISGGGTIIFEEGVYKMGSYLDSDDLPHGFVRLYANVHYKGAGISKYNDSNVLVSQGTVIRPNVGGVPFYYLFAAQDHTVDNVTFENIEFDTYLGTGTVNANNRVVVSGNDRRQAISISWSNNVTIRNCKFVGDFSSVELRNSHSIEDMTAGIYGNTKFTLEGCIFCAKPLSVPGYKDMTFCGITASECIIRDNLFYIDGTPINNSYYQNCALDIKGTNFEVYNNVFKDFTNAIDWATQGTYPQATPTNIYNNKIYTSRGIGLWCGEGARNNTINIFNNYFRPNPGTNKRWNPTFNAVTLIKHSTDSINGDYRNISINNNIIDYESSLSWFSSQDKATWNNDYEFLITGQGLSFEDNFASISIAPHASTHNIRIDNNVFLSSKICSVFLGGKEYKRDVQITRNCFVDCGTNDYYVILMTNFGWGNVIRDNIYTDRQADPNPLTDIKFVKADWIGQATNIDGYPTQQSDCRFYKTEITNNIVNRITSTTIRKLINNGTWLRNDSGNTITDLIRKNDDSYPDFKPDRVGQFAISRSALYVAADTGAYQHWFPIPRLLRGHAANRPTLSSDGQEIGISFFSLDTKRLNSWNGTKWYEQDGAVADVARSGATANRPIGSSIYVGFMYFDTTLGKPIYASAISGDTVTWVDATGTPV